VEKRQRQDTRKACLLPQFGVSWWVLKLGWETGIECTTIPEL